MNKLMSKRTYIPGSTAQGMTGVGLPQEKAAWIRLVVALGTMNSNWSMERRFPLKMRPYLLYQNMGPGMIALSVKELVGKVRGLLLLAGRRMIVLQFSRYSSAWEEAKCNCKCLSQRRYRQGTETSRSN
jgi:hypothetical protein